MAHTRGHVERSLPRPGDQPLRLRGDDALARTSPQSLYAQARLVLMLCEELGAPVHLAVTLSAVRSR
jgi:hypothetical protein